MVTKIIITVPYREASRFASRTQYPQQQINSNFSFVVKHLRRQLFRRNGPWSKIQCSKYFFLHLYKHSFCGTSLQNVAFHEVRKWLSCSDGSRCILLPAPTPAHFWTCCNRRRKVNALWSSSSLWTLSKDSFQRTWWPESTWFWVRGRYCAILSSKSRTDYRMNIYRNVRRKLLGFLLALFKWIWC